MSKLSFKENKLRLLLTYDYFNKRTVQELWSQENKYFPKFKTSELLSEIKESIFHEFQFS